MFEFDLVLFFPPLDSFYLGGTGFVMEFSDSGIPHDPLGAAAPDISLSAQEREIGGLGVYMVKQLMDSVRYRREGGKNILTAIKSLG